MTPETDTAFIPSTEPGQDLLFSTLITHVGNQAESDLSSDDPSLGDVFKEDKGKPDYKVLAIHYKAMYKADKTVNTAGQTKTPHKINYCHVHPPILHLDTELRSSTFEI